MSFKDADGQKGHKQYYLPTVEIKDYNVMIDGRNFFDQPMKDNLKAWNNIRKITTGRGGDYTIRVFIRLYLFQKMLWINCNRFK